MTRNLHGVGVCFFRGEFWVWFLDSGGQEGSFQVSRPSGIRDAKKKGKIGGWTRPREN